jgi:hypothetical protein
MVRTEKTVFLSYRRTNALGARAIFQNLTYHGYDVFFDFNGIASGDFEGVILENIRARAHFVVLLTPSALERCSEPGDWLRREIEAAITCKRNIVPLMLEGFNFGTPVIASQLTGALAVLNRYNALHVPADYFDEAMERLRTKYLNVPLDTVLHPASASAVRVAKAEQAAASAAPAVTARELTEEECLERGIARGEIGDGEGAPQGVKDGEVVEDQPKPVPATIQVVSFDQLLSSWERYKEIAGEIVNCSKASRYKEITNKLVQSLDEPVRNVSAALANFFDESLFYSLPLSTTASTTATEASIKWSAGRSDDHWVIASDETVFIAWRQESGYFYVQGIIKNISAQDGFAKTIDSGNRLIRSLAAQIPLEPGSEWFRKGYLLTPPFGIGVPH